MTNNNWTIFVPSCSTLVQSHSRLVIQRKDMATQRLVPVHPASCCLQRLGHTRAQFLPCMQAQQTPTHNEGHRRTMTSEAVKAHPAGPVLVQDGVSMQAPGTAQDLLSQHRDWSYTTALVRGHYRVVDWQQHVERLIRNMLVLAQHRPPVYAEFVAWHRQQDSNGAVTEAVQECVNPVVAAALQQLHSSLADAGAGDTAGCGQAMLVVTLGDRPSQTAAAVPVPSSPGRNPQGSQLPLSVLAWAKAVPVDTQQPGKAIVAGDPRPAAHAKHCDWVVARRPLEQLKQQAGADEVLLSDPQGALLEGLASNFYVIADAAQLAALGHDIGSNMVHDSAAAPPPPLAAPQQVTASVTASHPQQDPSGCVSGLVLLTTGPGDAALMGITQQRVLEACRQLQLPVVLQPAHASTAPAWKEAFITNCLKGIQAIQHVQLDGSTAWTAGGPGTITPLLQAAVGRLQVNTDMETWLAGQAA